ncbi:4Fe-4S binding protein [Intrasporangium sp. YIM S08009]|uniref:4Fe-4S binding protein n=1 Tax=Intrasporangium zincisolvens TaxID=3080018 RepID=UPI002B060819|nr:4Fe-4S binding protein [Intrasporangium sp. YIM S08009]
MGEGIVPGLVKGLAQTARTMTRRTHTVEYPDVAPALPPRTRGVIALTEENCTSCMLCARECPDWCIYIDSHKEEVPPTTPGGRARQRNVLDRFAIDFSLCMYCGICIEACPFDALHWSPEFEYAELDIRDLLHEKGRLGAWMATVPPPPALDPGSAEPAEVAASSRPARGARGAAGAGTDAGAPTRPTRVRPARDTAADTPAEAPARPARDTTPTRPLPAAGEAEAETPAANGDATQVLPTTSTPSMPSTPSTPEPRDEEGDA